VDEAFSQNGENTGTEYTARHYIAYDRGKAHTVSELAEVVSDYRSGANQEEQVKMFQCFAQ
jgi:hypothetical protein